MAMAQVKSKSIFQISCLIRVQSKLTPREATSLRRNCRRNVFYDRAGSRFLTILMEFRARKTPRGKSGWIATITIIHTTTRTG